MRATWVLTVASLSVSCPASSALLMPRASSRSTSSSRGVSPERSRCTVTWSDPANRSTSLRVMDGASRASPERTVRTAATSCSGETSLSRKPLAPADYARQVQAAFGQGYVAGVNSNNKGLPLVLGLIGSLALLLASAAGLGVLAAVLLQTRERAYQMGVFRAVGMTPRQTIAMVVCSVAGIGLAGVVIAVAGALLPATWAARNTTSSVLRAE